MYIAFLISFFYPNEIFVQVIVASDSLSLNQCSELGFASNNLMCSSCNDLKQFKLDELEDSCRQCCLNDDDQTEEEGKAVRKRIIEKI